MKKVYERIEGFYGNEVVFDGSRCKFAISITADAYETNVLRVYKNEDVYFVVGDYITIDYFTKVDNKEDLEWIALGELSLLVEHEDRFIGDGEWQQLKDLLKEEIERI